MKNYVDDINSYNVWLKAEDYLPPQTGDTPLGIAAKASTIYAQQIKNSRDVAPSTTNRKVIALRGFLKYLTEQNYIAAERVPQEGLKNR